MVASTRVEDPAVEKISVIIPCYNHGGDLPGALATLRAQTYPHWDAVVVDDGSTDAATRDLVAAWEASPPDRVRVLRLPVNAGVAAARNRGLAATDGVFVLPLDADDRLDPTFLQKTAARLQDDPSLAVVTTGVILHGAVEGRWLPRLPTMPGLLAWNDIHNGSLVRRTALVEAGGWDEAFRNWQDYDLWVRLLAAGARFAVVPEPLYHYHRSAGGLCLVGSHRNRDLKRRFVGKHLQLYQRYAGEVAVEQALRGEELVEAMDAARTREAAYRESVASTSLSAMLGERAAWAEARDAWAREREALAEVRAAAAARLTDAQAVIDAQRAELVRLGGGWARTRRSLSYRVGMGLTWPLRRLVAAARLGRRWLLAPA